jgi:hypothetical protein
LGTNAEYRIVSVLLIRDSYMHQGRKEWAREIEEFKSIWKCWSGFTRKELLMVVVELKAESAE